MPDPAPLARRYRRLLVTYPRAYRKHRGEEIVDTMLDAAPPGRARPTGREAVNLLASGLRARLGRPRSRMVVWCSILTALAAGLLGSAVGYRVAWQAQAPPLPSTAAVRGMVDVAAPGRTLDTQRDDYVFGWLDEGHRHSLLGEMARWPFAADLQGMEDPDLYGPGDVSLQVVRRTPLPVATAVRAAQARLRAHGWQVGCDPDHSRSCLREDPPFFAARKGGVVLQLSFERGWVSEPDPRSGAAGADTPTWMPTASGALLGVNAWVYRAATAAPLAPVGQLAAGLPAAALAWLAFGWLSRRTERRGGARLAYGLLTVAMLPSAVAEARAVGSAILDPGRGLWPQTGAPISALLDFGLLLDLVAVPALVILLVMALAPRRPAMSTADPTSA